MNVVGSTEPRYRRISPRGDEDYIFLSLFGMNPLVPNGKNVFMF